MKPFFSVIIPTYNRAATINRALQSLVDQTFSDFEVILVNDASSDNTLEIVKKFEAKLNIRIFNNSTNLERCISRNIGIENSLGQYICFLDSDDYHLPEHLSTFDQEIRNLHKPVAFLFTKAWNETSNGIRSERFCPDLSGQNIFEYLLRYTVNPQRWCVHRDILSVIKFDREIVVAEDLDTSLRIAAAGYHFIEIPERTTVYVANPDSFTHGDPEKWEKELICFRKIFKRKSLHGVLPRKEKNRLLSMSHFHLSIKCFSNKKIVKGYLHGFKSFFLYPKGYNLQTNKILFANLVYNIPILGFIIKQIIRFGKQNHHRNTG